MKWSSVLPNSKKQCSCIFLVSGGNGLSSRLSAIWRRIAAHAVAARVEPAGDVHDHRTAMSRKVSLHKLIEHDGARYNAAVHRRVLVGHRKIVVEPVDDLDRLVVGDRAARLRLLRAGVNRL